MAGVNPEVLIWVRETAGLDREAAARKINLNAARGISGGERNRAKDGGPNWYIVRRHRLGAALLDVARRGMAEGLLTPTRAARMLGVKPMAVYPLLAEPRRAFG